MLMLQTLLADRFQLVFHREQRAVPGYRMVLAKGSLRAQASVPDHDSIGRSQRGSIQAEGYTLTQLALKLAEVLQQPVLDATSVAGKFDLKLQWTPDDMLARPPSAETRPGNPRELGGLSVFAALQEQLGLKLEPAKVPTEVLIIDSAEKPSEN